MHTVVIFSVHAELKCTYEYTVIPKIFCLSDYSRAFT